MTNPQGVAPKPTPRPSIWRNASILVLFVLALVATCELLARLLPTADPDIAAQFRYFAARKDKIDTIFIGSSRLRFHVDPKQFDAETTERGVPTHSLNLAYQGMWPPESYYYLRQLLATRPTHLRWVIIELIDYRFGQVEHLGITKRQVVWHDWNHTGFVFRRILESNQPAGDKAFWLARHAQCFWLRSADPGRGANWLRERYFPSKKKAEPDIMKRGGFDPKKKIEWSDATRAQFDEEFEEFKRSPEARMRPGLALALREIVADVRKAGAEPIFIMPPSTRVEEKLIGDLPQGVPTWVFNNPVEYPRFYLPELLHDPGHLTEDGAREFTSLLAQRLAELAAKR